MTENPPTKAEFNVGTYEDGSGPIARVRIDATSEHCPDHIWIDGGDYSDQWFAFDWKFADALCAAIQQAKAMLAARTQSGSAEHD